MIHPTESRVSPAQNPSSPAPAPGSGPDFGGNLLGGVTLVGLIGVVAFAIVTLFDALQIVDDGYFYARYARNLLHDGALAWNPALPGRAAEVDFGPTSPYYPVSLLPFAAAFGDRPALVLLAGAVSWAAVAILAMLLLAARTTARSVRWPGVLLIAFTLATTARDFARLATNGMDTAFALAGLALALHALWSLERRPSTSRAVLVGAAVGLLFGVRADLLLFGFAAPTAGLVLGGSAGLRRACAIALVSTAATVGLQMLAAWGYFGQPLPLSFYAKTTDFFGEGMRAMFAHVPAYELQLFVLAHRFLLIVIVAEFVLAPRRWWRETTAFEKGIAAATLVFIVYYLGFVVQMVGENRRFYYPCLPALAWLASRGCARLASGPLAETLRAFRNTKFPLRGLAVVMVLALALPAVQDVLEYQPSKRALAKRVGRFNVAAMLPDDPRHTWFGVREFAALPDDLVLAMTEVGVPGVLCATQRIADLSGLNDAWIIETGGFTAAKFFERHRPDVIYMVFPDTYPTVDRELRASPIFAAEYELYADLGNHGIAVRRASPHIAEIRRILGR